MWHRSLMSHPFLYVPMKPDIEYVEQKFAEYNTQMFGGKLPPLPIRLSSARTFMGKLSYTKKRALFRGWTYNNFQLIISTRFNVSEQIIEDTIIHEMIHYYIMYHKLRDTSSHGTIFRDMMAHINSQYHRNVTISIRLPEDAKSSDTKRRLHLICISKLRDGRVGITIAAQTRLKYLWRQLPKRPDVVSCTWHISTNHFFNRFPRSITPRIYIITQSEVDKNLANAKPLDIHDLQ